MRRPETTGDWVQVGIYGAVVATSIGLIIRAMDRTVHIPQNYIPITGYNAAGDPIYWNPLPLAAEFAANFQGPNLMVYPETIQKTYELNNAQMGLLWNTYNKQFAQLPLGAWTLTRLIDREWTDWGQDYERFVARMKSIGLY